MGMGTPSRPLIGSFVVGVLLIAACGPVGDAEPAASSTMAAPPRWSAQVLDAVPGVDVPLQVGADGDQAVVLVVTDDGRITGFASGPDGRFRAGEPTETQIPYLFLGDPVRFDDGWLVAGSSTEDADGAVQVLRSVDGRTWSLQGVPAFDGAADVSSSAEVDGGLVAVGARRTAADPSDGGF